MPEFVIPPDAEPGMPQDEEPFVERRRPGRVEVSPHLIPLLRGKVDVTEQLPPPLTDKVWPTSTMRRTEVLLWLTLAVSILLWLSMAAGLWSWLFHDAARPPDAPPPASYGRTKGPPPDITQ